MTMGNPSGRPSGWGGWERRPPVGRDARADRGSPRRSRGCLVAALVVGVLALVAVAALAGLLATVVDEPVRDDGPDGPAGDVRIASCEVDAATKWPRAGLVITNRSGKASDYLVSVEFVAASGERLTEASTSVSRLAPGQVAHDAAQSLAQVNEPVTCRITDVSRMASL
ncbi:hypothetical protein JNUCC64_05080 [Streptomyces sp. JNUCC 64]